MSVIIIFLQKQWELVNHQQKMLIISFLIRVHLQTDIWQVKNSYDLFDFTKNKDIERKTQHFILNKSVYICYDQKSYSLNIQHNIIQNNLTNDIVKLYVRLANREYERHQKHFEIINFKNQIKQKIWRYPKQFVEGKPYEIFEGTIFKLGRQKLKLKKINLLKIHKKEELQKTKSRVFIKNFDKFCKIETQVILDIEKNSLASIDNSIESNSYSKQSSLNCRICLTKESNDNPFDKDLCKCSNTMPVHINCLIEWIKQKSNISKKENIYFFDFNQLQCDICKSLFPTQIQVNGQNRPMLDLSDKIQGLCNYILFDVYSICGQFKIGLLALDLKENIIKSYKIGRKTSNDIILKDISISRLHCFLFIKRNKVYLIDNYSKFGTLIKTSNLNTIYQNQQDFFIVGNLRFQMHLYKLDKKFCCGKNKKKLCKKISSTLNKQYCKSSKSEELLIIKKDLLKSQKHIKNKIQNYKQQQTEIYKNTRKQQEKENYSQKQKINQRERQQNQNANNIYLQRQKTSQQNSCNRQRTKSNKIQQKQISKNDIYSARSNVLLSQQNEQDIIAQELFRELPYSFLQLNFNLQWVEKKEVQIM